MAKSHFDMQWTGFGGCQALVDPAKTCRWKCIRRPYRPFRSPKELAVYFSLLFVPPGATQFLCDLEMSNSGSTRKKEAYQLPLKSEQRKTSVEGTDYIHFTACTMYSMFRALFGVPRLFARELLMNRPHCDQNEFRKSSHTKYLFTFDCNTKIDIDT